MLYIMLYTIDGNCVIFTTCIIITTNTTATTTVYTIFVKFNMVYM